MESGYITARAYAQEAIKNDDRDLAVRIMNEWNKGLGSQIMAYNDEFKTHGLEDRGGLVRSYIFTPRKRKNILTQRPDEFSAIEKRLIRRGR